MELFIPVVMSALGGQGAYNGRAPLPALFRRGQGQPAAEPQAPETLLHRHSVDVAADGGPVAAVCQLHASDDIGRAGNFSICLRREARAHVRQEPEKITDQGNAVPKYPRPERGEGGDVLRAVFTNNHISHISTLPCIFSGGIRACRTAWNGAGIQSPCRPPGLYR